MVLDVVAVGVERSLAEGGEGGLLDDVCGVAEAVADLTDWRYIGRIFGPLVAEFRR